VKTNFSTSDKHNEKMIRREIAKEILKVNKAPSNDTLLNKLGAKVKDLNWTQEQLKEYWESNSPKL